MSAVKNVVSYLQDSEKKENIICLEITLSEYLIWDVGILDVKIDSGR